MWLAYFCGRLLLKSNTSEIDGIVFSLGANLIEAPVSLIPYVMHIFLPKLLGFRLPGTGEGI